MSARARGRMRTAAWLCAAAVSFVAAAAVPASGQIQPASRLAGGPVFETYSFADPDQAGMEKITLLSIPMAARIALGRRAQIEVTGAYASGKVVAADGTESELTGPTDVSVALAVALVPDALTLTLLGAVPSGTATHDVAQAYVAGVMASDLLPFRVASWGSGGGLGMQLAATRRFQGFGAGVSVGYRQAGEFEPLQEDAVTYRPGNEIQARLALDTELGRGAKASLSVGFQRFGDDALDGANLFRAGNRIEAIGTLAFPAGAGGSAALYGGVLHRDNGAYLDARIPDAPTQDLVLLGGMMRRAVPGGFVVPRVDARLFRSQDGVGQGYVAGGGLGYELRSGRVAIIPSATARLGRVTVSEGQESSITGFEAGLTLRFGR